MLRLFTKRCLTTTVALRANKPPVLDWMQQAELDAAKASKGRKLQESGNMNEVMMGKIEHEFKVERVANALTSEDRLKTLIAKCEAHRHDRKLFNAIRKRAVAARQELIAQREAAGLVKDSQANSETIHLLFPIPAAM